MGAPALSPFDALTIESVPLRALTPHPRNYRSHPPDQIAHIAQSVREHGFYRPIVTARDLTILAGHGLALAAATLDIAEAPVHRLDLDADDPRAIKVLAADNELSRFADADDRALSELLRQIHTDDANGLLGTGYDEQMLANLVMVTRPASEIADFNEAAHWVGMPEYLAGSRPPQLVITFPDEAARDQFFVTYPLPVMARRATIWSTRWPWDGVRDDNSSLQFQQVAE